MRRNSFPAYPKWLLRATIILFIALLSLMATTTEGALINELPQTTSIALGIIDGNLVDDPDWKSLYDAGKVSVAIDLASGQGDDSFGKGAKEDTEDPAVVTGSVPKNKSDLLRFYVADERVDGEHYLYLAWVRSNTLGAANMDFEFNQSEVLNANGETPVRLPNDMLITFNMASEIRLGLSLWTETGPCESGSSLPCWGTITDLNSSGFAVGAVNEVSVEDPIDGGSLEPLTFGEAEINLTMANVFNPNECTNFGSAYLKSRSSDSFTASLKDFIAPQEVKVTNCGNIVVDKVTDPSSSVQPFDFSLTGGPLGLNRAFKLSDVQEPYNSGLVLQGSGYSVAEVASQGWESTSASCDNGDLLDNITVSPGQTVTCTFINTEMGNIVVEKRTDSVNFGSPDFSFSLSGPSGLIQEFPLSGGESHDSGRLLLGSGYSVAETLPDGWDPTSASCDYADSVGNITVGPGQTVTCTFINTERGNIEVQVVTDPAGVNQAFGFTLFGGPSSLGLAFPLNAGVLNAETQSSGAILPGSGYAAAETMPLPAGWDATGTSCDDREGNSDVGNINVSPGETVVCTFYYVQRGNIIVQVETVPSGDPAAFDFTGDVNATLSHGQSSTPVEVAPGAYSSTETLPAGWDLTGISCSGENSSVAGNTATFNVEPGETVTCTFINTKQLFTVITLVCLDGQLYASDVMMDGGPGSMTSLGVLPSGFTQAALCGLGGASYPGVEYGPHTVSVTISPAP